jgi:hypothetical protein
MSSHPRDRRARVAFSDEAAKQLEAITDEAELHALDRVKAPYVIRARWCP